VTETPTDSTMTRFRDSLEKAIAALKSQQHDDGHWCAELEGDSILESEYLLMKFILSQEHEPMADGRSAADVLPRIAEKLRQQQRADGGWGQFPGSGVDVSATVKAYFVLKLMGDDVNTPHMTKARECVLIHGGAEQCNSFTNFYLACLGQVSWNAVPAIPPEIVFLPRWSYFHLTKVSAWTRTMILPLSLVVTLRPTRPIPAHLGIDELFLDRRERHRLSSKPDVPEGWRKFFHAVDRTLKAMHKVGGTPLRRAAIKRAEKWILQRAGRDGIATTAGLGAIFPPMVYLQIAFHALGYKRDHSVIKRAERELDEFFLERADGSIKIQPCFSPVWDTGIALYALTDCGLTIRDESVRRAAQWLVSKECRHVGDWIENLSTEDKLKFRSLDREPGYGWYFEYHNAWYPDCDDTVMVGMALKRAGGEDNIDAAKRGVEWVLAMQNDDGGWAAFDRTKHRQILEYIPFADHNAMQDPSCPDITGRVLECLSWHGYDNTHSAVKKAIAYVRREQIVWSNSPGLGRDGRGDRNSTKPQAAGVRPQAAEYGCWFGRWGVNYIYGTWQSVIGPIRCGENPSQEWIQRAGRWIKSIQKPDGSFGESAMTYEDPSLKGQGNSTASQTAWAAMILQEIYGPDDPDLKRAINWLCQTQLAEDDARDPQKNPDHDPAGSWCETEFTGTGFPKVFYLRYHLYRLYFPIMAIGRYLAAHGVSIDQMRMDEAETQDTKSRDGERRALSKV
jgi:squalene-hopene/tetraprenyl-beta-curcumene cyclase